MKLNIMKNEKIVTYVKENSSLMKMIKNKFKLYHKVRDRCLYTGKYRGVAHGICNLRYKTQREIPVVIYNGSNYDYHLIVKELSKEFEANVNCLGENTEKYITFSVPLKKINKNGKLITYKLKFIDSYRFMQTSLSNLTDNLSEIDNKDCKKCMERNKIKSDCKYIKHKKNKLIYKCKKCNDISAKPINGLIEKFSSTYKFCNKDLDKFILLLRKGVYPYEYMDSWERFNETKLPSKKDFYNNFCLEDISDKDYNHAQKVWDTLRIKNLGEYHDLYIQRNTSLLPDVFEKFRDKCIEIYELDSAHFLSAPGLAWMVCLKKTNICLELLTDINIPLMTEKGIRGGILQAVHKYAKANNKYMKSYNKNVVSSYLMYLDANNLYGWAMCNKLPVSGFKWANDLSKYTKNFIKNYDENSNRGCIFEVDIEYPKELWSHHKDLPFLPERKKPKKDRKTCY